MIDCGNTQALVGVSMDALLKYRTYKDSQIKLLSFLTFGFFCGCFFSNHAFAVEPVPPLIVTDQVEDGPVRATFFEKLFSNTGVSFFYGKALSSHDSTYREIENKWFSGKTDTSMLMELRLKKKLFSGYNWGPIFNKKSPMYVEAGLGYYELESSQSYDDNKYSLAQYGYFGVVYAGLQSRELLRTSIFFQAGHAMSFYHQLKFKTPTGTIEATDDSNTLSLIFSIGAQVSITERIEVKVSYWDGSLFDVNSLPTAYQAGVSYDF